jgi:hypothetical protein
MPIGDCISSWLIFANRRASIAARIILSVAQPPYTRVGGAYGSC